MDAIIEFFTSLIDIIWSLINYVLGTIEDIAQMAKMLVTATAQLPEFLSFLPPPVVTLLISFLTVAVLYKILGREG